ncbi:MAG: 2-C-methyl-D-erythritol 4-phosphate cytidylyltransferase [Deltaproteobacteria bacterium RIFCSPLOWO2_02_FULL_53_8]|nr:MAG: 2-C-methyl-D-erythritol 4-phosphate cytidylyltransferase [Deltaproteobacteria bacterium RIFCSPLOWO2_02_FULL_53_8]
MPNSRSKTIVVIPSAGIGSRMGHRKKNYIKLLGKPVLAHTLTPFESCAHIDAIIIVTPPTDVNYCNRYIVKKYGFTKVAAIVAGGSERQYSVSNGITAALNFNPNFIMVHDGARPLVTETIIEETLRAAKRCGAAICAVPVKDTIKESDSGYVKSTIVRDALRAVQTPQAFTLEVIVEAYKRAQEDGILCTDDSALVERIGAKVRIVSGSYENIKITTPEDLAVAAAIMRSRAKDN